MDTRSNRRVTELWASALAAAAVVAATRALIAVMAAGYLADEASALFWIGFARGFASTLLVALPLALVAGYAMARAAERPLAGMVTAALALALFALVIACPWPLDSPIALGNYSSDGRLATVMAVLGACLAATLSSPALPRSLRWLGAAAAALVTAVCVSRQLSAAEASWPERPNLILVSIDTQRPDHLSCYGYERDTSPNIDRFAQSAVRFDQVCTPYPWTLLSHMSLFTSLNPTAHGVTPSRALPAGIPTLAERLRAKGYRTVALLDSVKWLSPEFAFDRGFELYRQISGDAAEKRAQLAPVLDDLDSRPFFLFLHFFDVHSDGEQLPYESDEEDYLRFAGDYRGDFTGCEPGLGCASRYLKALGERGLVPEPEDLEYLIALYDAGVRSFDREFGLVLSELEERGLYETSVIALTSDHGEAFFEHGFPLHAGVNDEVVRIPLLIRTPTLSGARAENQLLSMIDIAPTLLDYAGVSSEGMQGSSFRALIERDGIASEPHRDWVLLEDGRDRWHGIRTARWKAIRYEDRPWSLFDLEADPEERVDLLRGGAEPPPEFAALVERYESERGKLLEFRRAHSKSAAVEASGAERAELEALGYLGDLDE